MKQKSILYLFLIIVLLSLTLLLGPIVINYDKTGSNTYLLNKNYSYLSRDQILDKIDQDFILPLEVNIIFPNQEEKTFPLSSISAQINKDYLVSSMLYRRLNQGIFVYINYFFKPKNFNLEIIYDQDQLSDQIENLSSQTDKPFIPTEITLQKNNQIIVTNGSVGFELDKSSFINQLENLLKNGQFDQKISLEISSVGKIPSDEQISETKLKAQKLIKKNLILNENFNEISIDNQSLISWLGFDNNFQTDKIDDYVKNLNSSLKRDPVDAIFKFENNQVIEFKPAKDGLQIKEDELSNLIIDSLNKLINLEILSDEIVIPVVNTQPKIKNEDVNDLGIKDLLGRGTSSFKYSSTVRNINVEKSSSILNLLLVAPGETFSFVKALGEVTLEAGYQKAYIIRQGKTELDVGGGVCQVSTTFFRVLLDAGLNIIERRHHAYRVSYYEEGSKPGFDATIFIPSPDLKFINDTGHYLLIQNVYDGLNKKLTYEIYGTDDGRQVEIANYRQWGYQPPPPDVWIDDPTLPQGKVVQDETPVPGLKTAFDWIVTKPDGSILHQKTFQSNYVPWAAVFRRGTKI